MSTSRTDREKADRLLEIPEEQAPEVEVETLTVAVRGATIQMREKDDGSAWLKIELDSDGELEASPADVEAVARWLRRFLLMRKERV